MKIVMLSLKSFFVIYRGQVWPYGATLSQTGQNGGKQGKWGQIASNRAKQDHLGPNGARLRQTGPY